MVRHELKDQANPPILTHSFQFLFPSLQCKDRNGNIFTANVRLRSACLGAGDYLAICMFVDALVHSKYLKNVTREANIALPRGLEIPPQAATIRVTSSSSVDNHLALTSQANQALRSPYLEDTTKALAALGAALGVSGVPRSVSYVSSSSSFSRYSPKGSSTSSFEPPTSSSSVDATGAEPSRLNNKKARLSEEMPSEERWGERGPYADRPPPIAISNSEMDIALTLQNLCRTSPRNPPPHNRESSGFPSQPWSEARSVKSESLEGGSQNPQRKFL